VGSGRLTRHARPTNNRTSVFTVEWSGTSRVLLPHALSLGVGDAGLRGFRNATTVGGRRVIARLDEQLYIRTPYEFGDFGASIFADVGKLWAGDVPYGTTTPVRASLGASIRLAVPARSTKMWRLEAARPLNPEQGGNTWELRLSHRDITSFFWREPPDIDAARARAVPASVYNWP
jgi:hemolysin activation/secretion protein